MYTPLPNGKLRCSANGKPVDFSPQSPGAPPPPFPKPATGLSPKTPPQSPRVLPLIGIPLP